MSPEVLIELSSGCLLHFRSWGNECVAFEAASATTHLIEQPAGMLLEWVSAGPISLMQLTDRLLEQVTTERHDEAFAYVVNAMRKLASLGLVEIKETLA